MSDMEESNITQQPNNSTAGSENSDAFANAENAVISADAENAKSTAGTPEYDGPVLKVEHLKKYFPIQTNFFGKPTRYLRAVDDITFDVEKGKTIGVVGESGCGKTTLGRTILKLYESDGGRIVFRGVDITDLKKSRMIKYRTDIQLIFQDPYSSLPPRMTIGAIIAEAVKVHKIVPKSEVHSYVLDVMKKCGLKPQHYDRYPHEFSGGQRQRICIARALAVKPKLVICDEPVSALDVSIQAQIINLLKDLQKKDDLTYVFISHDLSVVKYITDNILVMYLGNAMELSDTEELFENPLHPYTKALFSAVPNPDPGAKMHRIVLEGDIPSPANPPDGCKFHTRCSKCMNVCKFKTPEYIEASAGHYVACHLYNDEIMNDLAKYDKEYEEYERKKQEEREKKELAALKKRHPFTWKKRVAAKQSEAPESQGENTDSIEQPAEAEPMPDAPAAVEPDVEKTVKNGGDDPSVESEVTATADTAENEKTANATDAVKSDEVKADEAASVSDVKAEEKSEAATTAETVEPVATAETGEKPVGKTSATKSTAAKKSASAAKSATADKSSSAKPTAAKKTVTTKSGTTAKKTTTAKSGTTAKKTTATKDTAAKAAKTAVAEDGGAETKSASAAKKPATAKSGTTAKKPTATKSGTAKSAAKKPTASAAKKKTEVKPDAAGESGSDK